MNVSGKSSSSRVVEEVKYQDVEEGNANPKNLLREVHVVHGTLVKTASQAKAEAKEAEEAQKKFKEEIKKLAEEVPYTKEACYLRIGVITFIVVSILTTAVVVSVLHANGDL